MSFAEKMEVASLVLEYAKVAFGYPVTIPVLIFALCYAFRVQVARAIDAVGEFGWGSARVKLAERKELAQFRAATDQTKTATVYATVQRLPPGQEKAVEATASFFGLTARLLPLIPKADRRRFIEDTTTTLPQEFSTFRAALLKLAEEAPEVRALNARDVITTVPADLTIRGGEVIIEQKRKGDDDPGSAGGVVIPPPRVR